MANINLRAMEAKNKELQQEYQDVHGYIAVNAFFPLCARQHVWVALCTLCWGHDLIGLVLYTTFEKCSTHLSSTTLTSYV